MTICTNCGNIRQVWKNQITGKIKCHRYGCEKGETVNILKQALLPTVEDCTGCIFRDEINCEEVRPSDCVEDGTHFVFTEDKKND